MAGARPIIEPDILQTKFTKLSLEPTFTVERFLNISSTVTIGNRVLATQPSISHYIRTELSKMIIIIITSEISFLLFVFLLCFFLSLSSFSSFLQSILLFLLSFFLSFFLCVVCFVFLLYQFLFKCESDITKYKPQLTWKISHLTIYVSTALFWTLTAFSVS
jgi:hypothetical protein